MADTKKTVHLIIERQDSPTGKPYTEEFEIPYDERYIFEKLNYLNRITTR